MNSGTGSSETGGHTRVEFTKPQKQPERKPVNPNRLTVTEALGAIKKDKPEIADRTDLANLANAGKRKYRRFDNIVQYREAKAQRGADNKVDRGEPGAQKAVEVDESKRIYEESDFDPLIRQTNDEISSQTNLAPDVQAAFASNDPLTINQTWFNTRNRISAQTWGEFINKYPDKAVAYAEKHPGIKTALEEIKRPEQANANAQAQTGDRVQTASDQLLADSVRVGENNQAQTAEQPSENNVTEVTTAEVNADVETKLLSAETVGVQATLLLGGEIHAEIDRAKIEAIAKGEKPDTEKANKASLGEREDYWNGENSPFKSMSFEQQLEKWQGTMQSFLDKYKGKPEAEFFKRVGIDLENENAVKEIYQTYFVDGEGDLGLFSQKIAQNNSAEQIQENKAIIQYLGKMYGDKSAKVAEQLIIGIKNAQTDTNLFIQSTQDELKKGPDMQSVDLINFLNMGNVLVKNGVPSVTAESGTSPIVDEKRDEEGAEEIKKETKKTFREAYLVAGDKNYQKKDRWKSDSGEILVHSDHLSFLPREGIRRKYEVKARDQDYDGRPRFYDVFTDEAERFERGSQLSVDTESLTEAPPGFARVPTPFLWNLLEVNPESLDKKGFTFETGVYGSDSLKAKKYTPVEPSFYGIGGHGNEYVGETTLGVKWGGVIVDRETLVTMQQRTIEYLEQQVQDGQMPQEMLDTARGILDTHKARNTVDDKWQADRGSGTSAEDPKLHSTFLQLTETWKPTGSIRQEEDLLVYDDEKYRKNGERREVEIATIDQETGRKVLTEQSWGILKLVPEAAGGRPIVAEATSNAISDRKGTWKKFIKPFTTDSQSLSKMQQMIRGHVEKQVADGRMDSDVLKTIDGLIKYKHSTLVPIGFDGQENAIYEIKNEKRPAYVEIKREPTLVEKIAEAAKSSEPVSSVDVSVSDIQKYLGEKKLPAGARIENLAIEFRGNTATMVGIVRVFIGSINFNLELANNPDGSGLMVTRHHVETKSGMIRSKLGDLEANLSNINSFISEDINDKLRYRNPSLRVLGLSISPEGKFLASVQNSQQAAA